MRYMFSKKDKKYIYTGLLRYLGDALSAFGMRIGHVKAGIGLRVLAMLIEVSPPKKPEWRGWADI